MDERELYKHLSNEKLQNTSYEDCVDAFLMDIRSNLLEGDFGEVYRNLMRIVCDISIIYAIVNELPLEALTRDYCKILRERIELARIKINERDEESLEELEGLFR